jgi:hypothetical protein
MKLMTVSTYVGPPEHLQHISGPPGAPFGHIATQAQYPPHPVYAPQQHVPQAQYPAVPQYPSQYHTAPVPHAPTPMYAPQPPYAQFPTQHTHVPHAPPYAAPRPHYHTHAAPGHPPPQLTPSSVQPQQLQTVVTPTVSQAPVATQDPSDDWEALLNSESERLPMPRRFNRRRVELAMAAAAKAVSESAQLHTEQPARPQSGQSTLSPTTVPPIRTPEPPADQVVLQDIQSSPAPAEKDGQDADEVSDVFDLGPRRSRRWTTQRHRRVNNEDLEQPTQVLRQDSLSDTRSMTAIPDASKARLSSYKKLLDIRH